MNWLVFHIVSGQSFFTGIILVIISALTASSTRPASKRLTALAFSIGVIAIAVSSTAIPYWLYALSATVTLAWIVSHLKTSWQSWAPYAMVGAWLIAGLFEIPYHIMPSVAISSDRTVGVIGDSVTAGAGSDDKAETWPSILAREHQLVAQDISHVGETAASALKRVKQNPFTAHVVVIEIGGNDILGSTTAAKFADDLDDLLSHLTSEDRQLLMFELPLPPFCHEYGRVQRAVAAKYNVKLIPKRVFLSIIAGTASTLDTIHLSQSGHQLMAAKVWQIIEPAFAQIEN